MSKCLYYGSIFNSFFDHYEDDCFYPRSDVKLIEDKYVITVDLPGVKKGDFKLSVDNSVLAITGERKNYGKFTRSYKVDSSIDTSNISATMEDGVLTISLNKKKEPNKSIEIQFK